MSPYTDTGQTYFPASLTPQAPLRVAWGPQHLPSMPPTISVVASLSQRQRETPILRPRRRMQTFHCVEKYQGTP